MVVSLITAVIFGAGDFCGGLAAKRVRPVAVVGVSHLVGLVGAAVAALAVGAVVTVEALAFGAIGGLFGGVGVWLLYRRLAIGPMHVVAPLTAVTSAVVPSLWGFGIGERLGVAVLIGLGVALVAIALVSSGEPAPGEARVDAAVVIESLLAGTGFGLLFIFFDATAAETAPWPVVGARTFTGISLGLYLLVSLRRQSGGDGPPSGGAAPTRWDGRLWALVVAVGALDTLANIGFLYAANRGALAVASVLTSLYPVSTVVLARLILGEHMTGRQRSGFILAVGASLLIAAG